MRVAVVVLLVCGVVAVAWFAGEQHRQSCILAEGPSRGCSVLPWSKGQPKKESSSGGIEPYTLPTDSDGNIKPYTLPSDSCVSGGITIPNC